LALEIRTHLKDPTVQLIAVMAMALALLPLLRLEAYFLHVILIIFMWATLASSINIIAGFAGYVNFGHVAFFGIGAYTTAILMRDFRLSPFLMTPVAGLMAAVIGALVGYPALRLRGAYFVIATIGLAYIFETITFNLHWLTGGGVGISVPLPPYPMLVVKTLFYYAMLILMLVEILTIYWIANTKIGLFLHSIREDEDAAEASGVNTTKYKMLAFIVSTFFAGTAGGLYSYYMSYIDPPTVFTLAMTVTMLLMMVLGGKGTILGPIIGASILTLASEAITHFVVSELNIVLYGALLIVVILFLPQGILGILRQRFPRLRRILR